LSPFLAIGGALAVRTVSVTALLALPMVGLVIARRRFWCRHLCPVGLISESCGKLRVRRHPAAVRLSWPPARFFALATLGGALLQFPIFLWMDPLALFAGAFNVIRVDGSIGSILAVLGWPLVVVISVLYPGTWCARLCPLGATQDLIAIAKPVSAPGRRVFLLLGSGVVAAAAIPARWVKRRLPLRPPGAVDEVAFEGGCIRCGSCARVCPTRIIQPAVADGPATGLLAPHLRFRSTAYCLQDCNRCGLVCPTGVIRPLTLPEKNNHVIGLATVDLSACLLTLDKECGVCIPRCPRAAIVDSFAYQTYTVSIQVLAEKCNGCGACVGICPPKVIRVST
jgi:ferredoxin